ncbi:hypothetical protein TNCT_153061 [Trichonephila clavata]|uniref:Uncharacterized protein n=1 Tax=Trichonephila clavata TaxID=2740835 RepID=A0A8X6HWN4_TRICU|nr:hypothetical protein TNCT_153061 [Trichonephila clavata]
MSLARKGHGKTMREACPLPKHPITQSPVTLDVDGPKVRERQIKKRTEESDPPAPVVVDGSSSFFNFTRDLVNYDKGLNRDDKLASTLFYKVIQRGEFLCNTPL